jgi:hypothetical protein
LPPVVSKTADAAARPAFTGGEVADGLYFVTSVVDYDSATPGGTTVQEAYLFEGNSIKTVVASSEQAEAHYAGTFSVADNDVSFMIACPIVATVSFEYSVDGDVIALQHGSDMNEVAYLEKQ